MQEARHHLRVPWFPCTIRINPRCRHIYERGYATTNVPIARAKPIDRLYEECSGYDLVIVPDAPLASAINRRLERPHFGPFATTPRRLAARQRETAEDRLAFIEVVKRTGLGWKRASAAVGDILQCWEYQGHIDAIRSFDAFDTSAIRTAIECIATLETTSGRLTEYEIDGAEYPEVAVVGERQLTTLERSILPSSYDSIDPFLEEAFDLPPLRIFDSPTSLVSTLLETIDTDVANDVAIVLDAGSSYSTLVESALEAEGIPFYGGPGFADDQDHRCFLQLLRTVFSSSDVRVGDVRPLLTHVGVPVAPDHEEKRLFEVDDPALEWVIGYCESCRRGTVADALSAYEEKIDRSLPLFRDELAELDLLEKELTESVVERLRFYVQTYEVPIERKNEGVLLADATSAAFVDRPVVFHLGLDDGWTHTLPRRPWVDREREFDRNVRDHQLLLQSGVERHYLVVDEAGGSRVAPTIYFEELLDDEFEQFSDLESIAHTRAIRTDPSGFDREPLDRDVESETVTTISQSSLNTFVNSPRDHLFSRLVDGPETHYLMEGTLFHDFAEFYVHHPGVVDVESEDDRDAPTIDDFVDAMIEEMQPFHREIDLETCRTKYRCGLHTIVEFLDEHRPAIHDSELEFLTATSGWGTNFFAEHFDRPVDSPLTEGWFEDEELGLKGVVDLVLEPAHLLDFKSGSRKRASAITKGSALSPPGDPPNYQALLYLTYWRKHHPGTELAFTFFHFLECLDEVVTGEPVIEECLTTVAYRPVPYDEFVTTEEVFEGLCEDASGACNKTFSRIEHEAFLSLLAEQPIPKTRDGTELAESRFGETLTEQMIEHVGDFKYVEKGCTQACRYLAGLRTEAYFADDLNAFEEFVSRRLDELNAYRRGEERFPVQGIGGEPNYRYVDHRDLLLEGERPGREGEGREDDDCENGERDENGRENCESEVGERESDEREDGGPDR